MPNLVKNVHSSFLDTFKDKLAIAFMALILVVSINYIVFSMVLVEREAAQALTAGEASHLLTNFPNRDIDVSGGTVPGVVLAELDIPDPMYDQTLKCGWRLDDPAAGYDNECIQMIDADGAGSLGASVSDDGDKYLLDLEYIGQIYNRGSALFTIEDNVCADSLVNPQEIYIDGSDYAAGGYENAAFMTGSGDEDCVPGNGGIDVIIYDADGTGTLDIGSYVNVASGFMASPYVWMHSEDVQSNQLAAGWDIQPGNGADPNYAPGYDYDVMISGNLYVEDAGVCGGTPGNAPVQVELETESLWLDYRNDGIFDPTEDRIVWDYSGCLTTGSCSKGGCVGTNTATPSVAYHVPYYVNDGSCVSAGGAWVPGKAVWWDNPDPTIPGSVVGQFDVTDSSAGYDPLSCLAPGATGQPIIPQERYTETIYLVDGMNFRTDTLEFSGSDWTNPVANQWQNDSAGVWSNPCGSSVNGECWYDTNANTVFDSGDSVIIDVNGNGTYESASDTILYFSVAPAEGQALVDLATAPSQYPKYFPADCDGNSSTGVGVCTPIMPGQALLPLTDPLPNIGNRTFCTDSLTNPTVLVADADNVCGVGAGAIAVNLYYTAAGARSIATIPINGEWSYYDVNTNGQYDNGENIYYNSAGVSVGTSFDYWPIIYTDLDGDNALSSTSNESILIDNGTINNGLAGLNGVIDRGISLASQDLPDIFNEITLQIAGLNDAGIDYNNVTAWLDFWPPLFSSVNLTDGRCNGGPDDVPIPLSYNNGLWATGVGSFPLVPIKACVLVDVLGTARNNATLQLSLPQLQDSGTPGLYDPGDRGVFFYSDNDGVVSRSVSTPYRYRIVGGSSNFPGHVDIDPIITPADQEPAPEPEPISLPAGVNIGDVIKSPSATTVYVVTSEGKRRPFPTDTVYWSWYEDPNWQLVKDITDQAISQIPLDNQNVVMRAGTWLIKSQSQSDVYAVEPGGIRRMIASEEIASTLYGDNWNTKIVDINDAFWSDYTEGADIGSAEYPTGSLLQYAGSADIYYIENMTKRLVNSQVFADNHFQSRFVIDDVDAGEFDYTTGTPLVEFADIHMAIQGNWLFPGLSNAFR